MPPGAHICLILSGRVYPGEQLLDSITWSLACLVWHMMLPDTPGSWC